MNPVDKQRAVDPISGLYQDIEAQLMQNIIRHIKNYDQPIPTDEWLMTKLAEIGKLNKENIKIISQASVLNQELIEQMLNEMAGKVIEELEPGFKQFVKRGVINGAVPHEKSKNINQVMNYFKKQAKDTLNMCNTNMLYKTRDAFKKIVTDTASTAQEIAQKLNILNKGTASVILGAESRQQALRKTIKAFNDSGIPAFVDKAGRNWTPEAYVNMAMRSTSENTATEIQMARCEDYGIDLIEVDKHSGARPKCAKDQGKIWDRSNKSSKYPHWKDSSYGEPDGILGINCGHHAYPYIEGVSIRRYFPTEEMDKNDRLYKAIQKQRAFERDIRKQKRECMMYDEIGDEEAFKLSSAKLKMKEKQLKKYVDGNPDLHRKRDREQVYGFGRDSSTHAISANKQYQKEKAGIVNESQIKQKNQKAAENWAKKHLGIKRTNYTNQSIQVVNNTNRALSRIYKEYPVLNNFVDEIEFKEIGAVAQASIRIRNGKVTTKMTFSPSKCTEESEIQKMIDAQVSSNYWTKKKGLYGIAKHEATHLSEYALALKRYGVDKENGGGDLVAAIKAIQSHEISEEIQRKALENCNLSFDYDIIKKKLCEYAAEKGAGEFLAEACSEYDPRALAKEVQKLFAKEMEK